MTEAEVERRYLALVKASQVVLSMFRSGHNPTEYQLNSLDGAIESVTALKTCGHAIIKDCDCEKGSPDGR